MHALARFALRRPGLSLLLLALITLGLAGGLRRLESEAGYRAFLGAGHPALERLDAFSARFGGGLPFAAVWSCAESPACESVFDPVSLRMAYALARRMQAVDGVRRVDGPATSPLLVPVFLELPQLRRLAPDGEPAPDLAELARRAVVDPTWTGQIVSGDGAAGALLVHLASSDPALGALAVAILRAELARYEAAGFRFALVGGPVEFVVAGDELARSAARIGPLMLGLVAAVLVGLFGSWRAAIVGLLGVGVAVAWTLGAMGWLGWPQNSLTQALAPLVLVIGVCDAMHVLAGLASRLADRPEASRSEREAALLDVTREVGRACALTTFTTAAGFGAFAVSGLESFARFGALAAFGTCAALLLCFTLLPILAVRLPPGSAAARRSTALWQPAIESLVGFSRRRSVPLLIVAGLLAGGGALGLARLRVDASFEDLYGRDSQVVRWAQAATRQLRAPETLEIALTPPAGTPAHAPAALRVVERVEELAQLEGLGAPLSILTPMRELHELVHGAPLPLDGSDPEGERARRMLRLLRFEDAELVGFFLDPQGGYRISLQSQKLPQAALRRLLAEVDRRIGAALPAGWSATVTGPLAVVATMIDEIRSTQLRSFAAAAGLVFALLLLGLRSFRMAGLVLVPAALPVVLSLGAMGVLGVPLDVGTAMVGAVLLGLAVDDVIHLLLAYQRHRDRGRSPEDAVQSAVRDVGRALVTSSAALASGFLVLALTPWRSLASFGLLAAIAIFAALASALLVLPALLAALGDRARSG